MNVKQLHDEYGKYLLKCLYLYGVPKQECEDLRQDLYTRLLEYNHDEEIRNPKGFCANMARNMAFNWLRNTHSKPKIEPIMLAAQNNDNCTTHPDLEISAVAQWERMMDNPNAERIIQGLEVAKVYKCDSETFAIDLIADLLYGLNYSQIGEKYNVSNAAICQWLKAWYIYVNKALPRDQYR